MERSGLRTPEYGMGRWAGQGGEGALGSFDVETAERKRPL